MGTHSDLSELSPFVPTKARSLSSRRRIGSHPLGWSASSGILQGRRSSQMDDSVIDSADATSGSFAPSQDLHQDLDSTLPDDSQAAAADADGAAAQLQQLQLGAAPQFMTAAGTAVQVPHEQVQYDTEQVVEAGWKGMLHLDVDTSDLPLIADKQGLNELASEYHNSTSMIVQKVQHLALSYGALRRSRGDGNCYFRSFLFGYLEAVAESADTVEAGRMLALLQAKDAVLRQEGCPADRYEAGVLWLSELLTSIGSAPSEEVLEDLVLQMRAWATSMQAIQFMRFICASEINSRADHFAPFIIGLSDGDLDVNAFNQRHVAMMGEESDHIQLVAMADALQVPVHVVYLDGQAGSGAASLDSPHHDFAPVDYDAAQSTAPWVHVLYRPGHYDLIYPL